MNKYLVIIPTYNEKENIENIIAAVLGKHEKLEVLIVDDNSPDGTGDLVEKLRSENPKVHVMHREKKMGLGTAYIAGFKFAIKNIYDAVFEMDADFSHDPSYLADFIDKIQEFDVVVGSRYLKKVTVRNWPLRRLLLSYCANKYIRLVTGMPLTDATGGFKCFRRKVLEAIDLDGIESEGYAFQVEMNYRCWEKGFSFCEIPFVFVDRRAGQTKMNNMIILEAFFLVLRLRLRSLLGRFI